MSTLLPKLDARHILFVAPRVSFRRRGDALNRVMTHVPSFAYYTQSRWGCFPKKRTFWEINQVSSRNLTVQAASAPVNESASAAFTEAGQRIEGLKVGSI